MRNAHFHFWSHERLTDRSISKRYPQSVIAKRVEESSTCRAIFQWRQKADLQLTNQRNAGQPARSLWAAGAMLSSANKKRSIKSTRPNYSRRYVEVALMYRRRTATHQAHIAGQKTWATSNSVPVTVRHSALLYTAYLRRYARSHCCRI